MGIVVFVPAASTSLASSPSDSQYVHQQGVPATTWVVHHRLGKVPSIVVVDSTGAEVRGDVVHDSPDQATLSFAYPFSGAAFCN